MNRKLWGILGLGTFVYLFLAPFFFHPDLKGVFYRSQFLANGVLDIYRFMAENPAVSHLGGFVYLPLTYFIFGILFFPVNLIAGQGFLEWIGMGNDAVEVQHIFRYLFLIKLPMIAVHIATGVLLVKLVEDEFKKKAVLLLWFFNPVSIYVVAFMGQIDGIPVLLTVASLVLAKRHPVLAALALGLGGAVKSYPLLLLPFLALTAGRSWKERLKITGFGFLPYILFILPFLKTPAFYSDAFASGLSQRIFQFGLPIGFGEQILVVPGILLALFLLCVYRSLATPNHLPGYYLSSLLVVLAGSHFHPQWVLWAVPFVSLVLVHNKIWLAGLLFFVGYVGTVFLLDDKFLTFGLLGAFDSAVFFLPPLSELVQKFYDPRLLQSMFHTIFAVSAFWIGWTAIRKNTHE